MTRKQIDPISSLEYMSKHAKEYAEAKAKRRYLEEFRKSKKALIMQQHLDKPIGAQEREAYSHADYLQVLAALQAAIEIEETLWWKLSAAQTAVEVWRTQSANDRKIDRAAA